MRHHLLHLTILNDLWWMLIDMAQKIREKFENNVSHCSILQLGFSISTGCIVTSIRIEWTEVFTELLGELLYTMSAHRLQL